MSLFEVQNIAPKAESNNQPNGLRIRPRNRFAMGKKAVALSEVIGEIRPGEAIHIPSLSSWSMHELIEYILQQTGPAEVWLTSWSIKQKAVQLILELLQQGHITALSCVFDGRVKTMCPDAWRLADYNMSRVFLTKIHAKVVVIQNDTWGVSIVSTANLTRNPRIECYVITADMGLSDYHKAWINDVINEAKPFES